MFFSVLNPKYRNVMLSGRTKVHWVFLFVFMSLVTWTWTNYMGVVFVRFKTSYKPRITLYSHVRWQESQHVRLALLEQWEQMSPLLNVKQISMTLWHRRRKGFAIHAIWTLQWRTSLHNPRHTQFLIRLPGAFKAVLQNYVRSRCHCACSVMYSFVET